MLYLFLRLKPSPLGWGVLSVLGAVCFAFAARDALRARRDAPEKATRDAAAGGPRGPPRSRFRRLQ